MYMFQITGNLDLILAIFTNSCHLTNIERFYRNKLSELVTTVLFQMRPNSFRITGELGSGQFGTVAKGKWQSKNVAIKTLKDDASEEEKVKFLQEAAIMGQFHHPNIIKLYGVVTVREPVS